MWYQITLSVSQVNSENRLADLLERSSKSTFLLENDTAIYRDISRPGDFTLLFPAKVWHFFRDTLLDIPATQVPKPEDSNLEVYLACPNSDGIHGKRKR